jgi:hypothetical protein
VWAVGGSAAAAAAVGNASPASVAISRERRRVVGVMAVLGRDAGGRIRAAYNILRARKFHHNPEYVPELTSLVP